MPVKEAKAAALRVLEVFSFSMSTDMIVEDSIHILEFLF